MKFFLHKVHCGDDANGYGQFTFAHFIWIAISILSVISTSIIYYNSNPDIKMNIRIAIAFTLIIIDIIKMIAMYLGKVKVSENLPLEICSFAAYSIVFDCLLPDNNIFPAMLLILFLPAAFMAILFPTTSVLPNMNFYVIHQFLYHSLIIAYVIMRFVSKEIVVDYSDVLRCVFFSTILVSVMYIVDITFKRNFMFLTSTYDNPLLNIIWNKTGGGFKYTIYLYLFCAVCLHIFYLFFKVIQLLFL